MEWTIKKAHEGMLIREFLREEQGFSRRIVKSIKFDGGRIMVNGKTQTVRYSLVAGDKLTVIFPEEQHGDHMQPEQLDLAIMYEDADIIVINKAAGMAVIPSLHHPTGTVANGLLAHYSKQDIHFTIHIVTRLDRDTSGLMLVAKHRYSHSILAESQKMGEVKRHYQAIVQGKMEQKKGTINKPIGRKPGSIIEREIRMDGKSAITHYLVEKQADAFALADVRLETGRTHQIRVHFSGIGHPLCGDTLYGGSKQFIDRQALHCYQLSFNHPITKEPFYFSANMPADMAAIMQNK
ncbi:hypothetical protein M948_19090 [Virgibacillus sp. CM-4]|uniref:RluA family pseudouridine synthase n=1 Tax=Virgibacillus sp. CM-4 TaxID=1354277 RepID=UPI0003887D8C|nr:RluA family pseudouridine synthase [Virgibacillus sp. CM-4]EQB35207.1 hypothetical protein M948_19090 [Virgibacillus sp. CM-4]